MAIKVGMVSLGCTKNQVDAERLLALIVNDGFEISADPQECDVVIINTCGFIEDAKRESIESILEFCELKKAGVVKVIVVTGCLAERYRDQLAMEIPEADVILGIGKNFDIVSAVQRALNGETVREYGEKEDLPLGGDRLLTTPNYSVYLKIAEGCDNRCTFCAIPLIRGGFRSRPMEEVLEEARELAANGAKELNLIAQDSTRYGLDLYGELKLAELLRELCKIDGFHWIRILYGYPERVTEELLEVMASEPKIVKYIDLPLQHCNGRVLREMNRPGDHETLSAKMNHIREMVPGIALRTTLIAGFPGETQEEFEELCEFVQEMRFERLGCFAYSAEEDTIAGEMDCQLDEEVKRHRAEIVMQHQMDIAFQMGEELIGQTIEVLVEDYDFDNLMYVGRSAWDAPDIDTKTMFTAARELHPGDFVQVEILDSDGYDLIGREVEPEEEYDEEGEYDE